MHIDSFFHFGDKNMTGQIPAKTQKKKPAIVAVVTECNFKDSVSSSVFKDPDSE